MKRLIAVIACACSLSAFPPAAAQVPDVEPEARAYEAAESFWMTRVNGGNRFGLPYMVTLWVERELSRDTGEVEITAVVAKGPCNHDRERVYCWGVGYVKRLAPESFELDPLLRTGSATVKSGKYSHSIRWTARDAHPMVVPQSIAAVGDGFTFAGGSVHSYMDAAATGTIFGKKMNAKGLLVSYMVQHAYAQNTSRYEIDGLRVSRQREGNRVLYEVSFKR
jgi:hypothetical protein